MNLLGMRHSTAGLFVMPLLPMGLQNPGWDSAEKWQIFIFIFIFFFA